MKNCKQIAIEWGLSERTINDFCKKGKLHGAIKVGKMWQIPDDAKKPVDGRITSGKFLIRNHWFLCLQDRGVSERH